MEDAKKAELKKEEEAEKLAKAKEKVEATTASEPKKNIE